MVTIDATPSNEVTSADGGQCVLFAIVAQCPAAAEFFRWAETTDKRITR